MKSTLMNYETRWLKTLKSRLDITGSNTWRVNTKQSNLTSDQVSQEWTKVHRKKQWDNLHIICQTLKLTVEGCPLGGMHH